MLGKEGKETSDSLLAGSKDLIASVVVREVSLKFGTYVELFTSFVQL